MSKDYIERDAVLKLLSEVPLWKECTPLFLSEVHLPLTTIFKKLQNNINSLSAADVEPVVHGEWIEIQTIGTTVQWQCSECKHEKMYTHIGEQPNYCPNCGVKNRRR